jgi:hypothetical protein
VTRKPALELAVLNREPRLRVTKWCGDVPVEAKCSICEWTSFKVAEWNSGEPLHHPDRQHYQDILQQAFELHCEVAHGAGARKNDDGTEDA